MNISTILVLILNNRLDEFCEAIGVNYHVGWYGDRTVIMFLSDNYHHIEEVREQLPNNVH